MKKLFKLLKDQDFRNIVCCFVTLSYCIVAGYYGLDMFIMYLNPMHLIMVGGSLLFSLLILRSLVLNLMIHVYYPIKANVIKLFKKFNK